MEIVFLEEKKMIKDEALKLHRELKGKFEIKSKVEINSPKDLTLAYTPGVAEPCLKIKENPNDVYTYTTKGNIVAVITDGTAVLGLGDIGPKAALPVMEGKSILLKRFADIDSFPLCLDTKDPEEIIKTCKYLAPSLGAINLEDISAPRCVTIERRLKDELDIPVFHDDQHGTAIVVGAALLNSCRLTKKKMSDLTVVLSGTGAAGSSIARMLKKLGVGRLYAININGVVDKKNYDSYDFLVKELIDDGIIDTKEGHDNTLASLMKDSNAFIGVSAPNLVSIEMVKSMAKDPFIFALANPTPEISYEDAKLANAYVIGTGRSDHPNQINNLLAFPGIFRGALDSHATKITEEMKMAASLAIASLISDNELTPDYVIPSPFDSRVVKAVSQAVMEEAQKSGVIRKDK